jgi:LacI family transcriptional regulator
LKKAEKLIRNLGVKVKTMSGYIPTLKDVADAAGVSKSTVSRILNNRSDNGFSVKEELRQRVLETAKELNYRPNLMARSLTIQSTQMIHILGGHHALSNLGNIYQTVVNHFTRVFDSVALGYDVTVDMSEHAAEASEMPAWKIDGAVILARCTERTTDQIHQMQVPHVVVNSACPRGCYSVVPDDVGGTCTAVDHLHELGHFKIAYSGPLPPYLAGHSSLQDRHDTFLSEMNRRGLEPVLSARDTLVSAEQYLKEVVVEKQATAILAYGHMEAVNLLQAAHALAIPVPQRLSVMCFCDERTAGVISPGMTFIDLNSEKLGKVAAELLLHQIQHPAQVTPQRILLPEKLMVRNTTASPAH